MDATSGRLIASTSRYPLSFDHRSITARPFHNTHDTRQHILFPLTKYSTFPVEGSIAPRVF
jgi:hypothetical protein